MREHREHGRVGAKQYRWRQGRNRTAGNKYSYPKEYSREHTEQLLFKALENLFHARPKKPKRVEMNLTQDAW